LQHDVRQEPFKLGEEPYWVTQELKATLIPDASGLVDRLLPRSVRMRRLRARVVSQMQELALRNAENLRWAILRGIDETFRHAGGGLEERLDDAIAATRGVIEEALARRRDRSATVEPEVARLKLASSLLSNVAKELVDRQSIVARDRG